MSREQVCGPAGVLGGGVNNEKIYDSFFALALSECIDRSGLCRQ